MGFNSAFKGLITLCTTLCDKCKCITSQHNHPPFFNTLCSGS